MITDVDGVRVGHWTDADAKTGCTVVLLPAGTVASGEVRGGAPGTREWALLAPERLVPGPNAVVLAGGSAFGLAACDGVVRWCEERGIGFTTAAGPVPIVVGTVLFDLGVGSAAVRPSADAGYAACVAATAGAFDVGPVGAGTGATVGKWRGRSAIRPGGLASVSVRHRDVVVGVLVAVNAFGDVLAEGEEPPVVDYDDTLLVATAAAPLTENTTLGVVATNAALSKTECLLVAQSAEDALARVIVPAHGLGDGDAVVAASAGSVPAPVAVVRELAAVATARAVREAVVTTGT